MKGRKWLFWAMAAALTFGVGACSREQAAKKSVKKFTTERARAIEDYARRPLDKARQAQQIGQEHTKSIDKAIDSINGH